MRIQHTRRRAHRRQCGQPQQGAGQGRPLCANVAVHAAAAAAGVSTDAAPRQGEEGTLGGGLLVAARCRSVSSAGMAPRPPCRTRTLMMSLTPSRVSTASGTHSRNQPVLNTRATSCFTCMHVAGARWHAVARRHHQSKPALHSQSLQTTSPVFRNLDGRTLTAAEPWWARSLAARLAGPTLPPPRSGWASCQPPKRHHNRNAHTYTPR